MNKFYKLKKIGTIICLFCTYKHHQNELTVEFNDEDENVICQCENECHFSFNFLELSTRFTDIYAKISQKINFSEMINKLKNELYIYLRKFDGNYNKFDLNFLIDSEVVNFSCHNLIFNGVLLYTLNDEINLMDILIENLNQKDNYITKNDKTNMPLSYLFHFYRKYLFLHIGNIDERNIDVMSFQSRLKKLKENMKFYENLCNHPGLGKFFSIKMIQFIFEKLLDLKFFKLRCYEGDFVTNFLRQFLECYCYSEEEIISLLNIARKIIFKKNDDEFNNHIRNSIDIIYNIAQNMLIDLYIQNLLSNEYDKYKDYTIYEKIIQKFFSLSILIFLKIILNIYFFVKKYIFDLLMIKVILSILINRFMVKKLCF